MWLRTKCRGCWFCGVHDPHAAHHAFPGIEWSSQTFSHMPGGAPLWHHGRDAQSPGVAILEHAGRAHADLAEPGGSVAQAAQCGREAASVRHLGPTCPLSHSRLAWYRRPAAHGSSVIVTGTTLQVRGDARDRDRTKAVQTLVGVEWRWGQLDTIALRLPNWRGLA